MVYYPPNEFCVKCGRCCTTMPGIFMPDDIIMNMISQDLMSVEDVIEEMLASGFYAIDWWEDESPLYYLRPATVKGRGIFDPSWGGQCIMLGDNGCSLKWSMRPHECKILRPRMKPSESCVLPTKENFKLIAGRAWEKLGVNLAEIGRKVKHGNVQSMQS